MKKAFVLLSGGMDSTTCLHQAIFDYMPEDPGIQLMYGDKSIVAEALRHAEPGRLEIPWVEAISIYYGQRHKKEMEYAKSTCERLGIKHTILDVGSLLRGDSVMLTDDSRGKVDVPNISYADIKGVSPTYVPFRNGLMLSALTAHAQKWVNEQNEDEAFKITRELAESPTLDESAEAKEKAMKNVQAGIYFGAHAEDAHNWAYPDCTPEFIGAMANSIYIGSYMQIRLHTPIQWASKAQVVNLGESLGVDWKNTWSCYKGEEYHCGTCPTCLARQDAFLAAGTPDPTPYAKGTQEA